MTDVIKTRVGLIAARTVLLEVLSGPRKGEIIRMPSGPPVVKDQFVTLNVLENGLRFGWPKER